MKMSINNLQSIVLGREKDSGVKTIKIDCSEWKENFPQLTKYRIEVTSPNGIIYCPEVTMNEHILTWPITKSDTALTGKGAYQIVATGENGERLTSAHLSLNIYSIMPGTAQETPPEYIESWIQNIVDTAERAELAAKKAEDAAAGIVITPEEIQSAVDSYLIKNPIEVKETDPTVPDWAKEKKKPTYTAEEVGAQPKGDYALKSDIPAVPAPYTLPVASADTLGGVKVGEGLQMNGDVLGVKPEGEWELIESITLDSNVTTIARSQTPDGEPYSYKKIRIIYKGQNASEASKWVNFSGGSKLVQGAFQISGTNDYVSILELEAKNGELDIVGYGPALGAMPTYKQMYKHDLQEWGYTDYIDQFSLVCANEFVEGAKITIWGIQA